MSSHFSTGRWTALLLTETQHYSLRERSHNYRLPDRASTLMDKNFLIRMLFKDLGCSQSRLTLH